MIQLQRVLSFHVVSRTSANAVPPRFPSLALHYYLSQVSCSGALSYKEESESPLALLVFPAGTYTKLMFVGKRVFGNKAQSAKWKEAAQEIRQSSLSGCFSIFYHEGGETLEQVAQRSCRCPIPGSVQGQIGWGFEEPDLVKDVPAHGGGDWTR